MRVRTGDQALVKALNKAIVQNILRLHSPVSRAEIAKISGLNKATVSALVDELIAEHIVREIGPGDSNGGRRPQMIEFNEQAGVVAGAEIGVGFLRVVIVNLKTAVLWRKKLHFDPDRGPEAGMERLAQMIEEGLAAVPAAPRGLLGIGVGVPGLVDHRMGRLEFAPNLKWRNVPIREWFDQRFPGVMTLVDNEANAGAVGELWAGSASGARTFVYLSVGMGVGAGVVLGGDLYRGVGGVAGEIGHTTIDLGGLPCTCGNRGCLELYASEAALRQQVARMSLWGESPTELTVERIVGAARQGDPVAVTALERVGEALGVGIANVINTFNPALVVIGGDLAEAGEYVLQPASRIMDERAMTYPRSVAKLALSTLGAEACAVGAGALVLQEQFRLPAITG